MRLLGGTLPTAGSASARRLSPRWTTDWDRTDRAGVTDGDILVWVTGRADDMERRMRGVD